MFKKKLSAQVNGTADGNEGGNAMNVCHWTAISSKKFELIKAGGGTDTQTLESSE